jgi:hypothetical protein
MARFHIPAVATLAFLMLAPDATAQVVVGVARGGIRGAVIGDFLGGPAGATTDARVGAVAGAARAVGNEAQAVARSVGEEARAIARTVGEETRARALYQGTPAYLNVPRSDFYQVPPQVLTTYTVPTVIAPSTVVTTAPVTTAPATTAPATTAPATTPGGEAVLRKPILGVTFPSDWRMVGGDRYISAVSGDGQAYAMLAILDGAKDRPEGVNRVKGMLPQYLKDIKFDDQTETKRGASVVTGTAKGKKTGVDVVFAVGVLDDGAGDVVGAAFVVDAGIEEHYKETIRQICQTIRLRGDLAVKK